MGWQVYDLGLNYLGLDNTKFRGLLNMCDYSRDKLQCLTVKQLRNELRLSQGDINSLYYYSQK